MKSKSKLLYFLSIIIVFILFTNCAKKTSSPAPAPVTPPTSLQMTIYDGSGATMRVPSPGALVQLFLTNQDRMNKTNPVTGLVASNGQAVVTFTNLKAINYFFNAYSADMMKSNATTFNQTDPLTAGIVNKLSPVVK